MTAERVIDLSRDTVEAATGSTLLVASAGGHLSQLHQLRPRFTGLGDVTWITFDTPQARSLLAGERVVFVRYTAPRDMRSVVANGRRARQVLTALRPAHVISTGSAIALSFLPWPWPPARAATTSRARRGCSGHRPPAGC